MPRSPWFLLLPRCRATVHPPAFQFLLTFVKPTGPARTECCKRWKDTPYSRNLETPWCDPGCHTESQGDSSAVPLLLKSRMGLAPGYWRNLFCSKSADNVGWIPISPHSVSPSEVSRINCMSSKEVRQMLETKKLAGTVRHSGQAEVRSFAQDDATD